MRQKFLRSNKLLNMYNKMNNFFTDFDIQTFIPVNIHID